MQDERNTDLYRPFQVDLSTKKVKRKPLSLQMEMDRLKNVTHYFNQSSTESHLKMQQRKQSYRRRRHRWKPSSNYAPAPKPKVIEVNPLSNEMAQLIHEENRFKTDPEYALYPYYHVNNTKSPYLLQFVLSRIVLPLQEHKRPVLGNTTISIPVLFDHGIMFYAYSNDKCDHTNRFTHQALSYMRRLRAMAPNTKVALVTNCDLLHELFDMMDIVIPIHPHDLINVSFSQFFTRMLYNAHPPFRIALVMDIHVTFCDKNDVDELFTRFDASPVDIAYSTRKLNHWTMFGAAVIYRRSWITTEMWRLTSDRMNNRMTCHDDQFPTQASVRHFMRQGLRFRWLSSNWVFSFHNVDGAGHFEGKGNFYASSVLINGRVRFIHKGIHICNLVNGKNLEWVNRTRAGFRPGQKYRGKLKKAIMVFSQEEMVNATKPERAPNFNWKLIEHESRDGLYWYKDK